MKTKMRKILSSLCSLNGAIIHMITYVFFFVTNASAQLQGDVYVHDPCAIRVGSTTYAFSTGYGTPITMRKTTDPTMYSGWTYVKKIPATMPSWIGPKFVAKGIAVPDNLWAPDINYWNGTYYLYYASSVWNTNYAVCGLATATNIEGPWTDQGMVTDVNYPIDTHIVWSNNIPYITWGSWTGSGIYIHEIDPSNGKLSTSNTTMTRIATGIEGASIVPNDGYFYLFGSKGTCCVGVNSTYYTIVARATNIRGPYSDRNGISMLNGGGTTILTSNGNEIGPGGGDWFDVGTDKYFVYHYYDGANNGRGTMNMRKIDFAGIEGQVGWPTFGPVINNTYYKLQNRGNKLYIDGMGRTSLGSACGQYSDGSSYNQQWYIEWAGSYIKFRNRATGMYLDGMGLTTNSSACGQYCSGSSINQQWALETSGSYVKFKNRATGLYLDGMGRTANGSDLGQYGSSGSRNQQFTLSSYNPQAELLLSLRSASVSLSENAIEEENDAVEIFPNPVSGSFVNIKFTLHNQSNVNIDINSLTNKLASSKDLGIMNAGKQIQTLDVSALQQGTYILKVLTSEKIMFTKLVRFSIN